jgi:hypothetical protein
MTLSLKVNLWLLVNTKNPEKILSKKSLLDFMKTVFYSGFLMFFIIFNAKIKQNNKL